MVINAQGALAAANEAAQALFGHGLAHLARERFRPALPAGSPLAQLIDRCLVEDGAVRERGMRIDVFGQPHVRRMDDQVRCIGSGARL